MSYTATPKTVQPKLTYLGLLPAEYLVSGINFRLNAKGRALLARMENDNERVLLTVPGYNYFRSLGYVKEKKETHMTKSGQSKERTVVTFDVKGIEHHAQEKFYSLVDLNSYPKEVSQMYAEPSSISIRSRYYADSYYEGLAEYGINRNYRLPPELKMTLIKLLDQHLGPWATSEKLNFDFKDFLASGRWLVHIKSGSNSGYAPNVKQDKAIMSQYAAPALKIYNAYVKGYKIDWWKLAFEQGFRTERKKKIRVICQAAVLEKPFSATINTVFDSCFMDLPFNLPRRFGPFWQLAEEVYKYNKGFIYCKDFEGFDKHIPLDFFILLRDWFKSRNNTFCTLVAFELDLIINGVMIVAPSIAFKIGALPSGIGITQLIGSIVHWLIDIISGVNALFSVYQSDDTLSVVDMTLAEVDKSRMFVEKHFKMPISPLGKKSIYSDQIGICLQKVIDRKAKIYYNHEQRCFTNGLFRERVLNDGERFEITFELAKDDKETRNKNATLAYLGNLVAYGSQAPSLCPIIAFMYGKKTGLTKTRVEWGLENLQKYMTYKATEEEHKLPDKTGWLEGLYRNLLAKFGWSEITASQVRTELEQLGGAISTSVK